MDILPSKITNIMQIEVAVPTAYRPVMELSAIPNWDTMAAVERTEAEEALSIVHEHVIETHQRRNFRFQAVNHGIL